MTPLNVFSSLFTYGAVAEENYLTESLVYVLNLLLQRLPSHGVQVLNHLVGPLPLHPLDQAKTIRISTQVTVDVGRPDIQVDMLPDTRVYIEVKHDSPLGPGQLEYYLKSLQNEGVPNHQLVFLSRSRAAGLGTTLLPDQYHHVCWYEIYKWLEAIQTDDEVCTFIIREFLSFLEDKNMSLKKVGWEYIEGVPAFLQLTHMMETAVKEIFPDAQFKRTAGWSWRGFYLDNTYFFGIRYEDPLVVTFENDTGNNPTFKRAVRLEEIHFFSLTNDAQFESLVRFLQSVLDDIRSENI